jgi:predicted metal-dependent hydrolase
VIDRLTLDGLEFEVRRAPRRKTIGLTVERDGALVLAAPAGCDEAALREAVKARLLWVHTKLAARRLLQGTPPRHRYLDGEGYWFLGASHRLKVVAEGAPLRLHGGWFELSEAARPRAREHFIAWYGAELEAWAAAYGGRFAARLGVVPASVRAASLGHRWGSCDADGGVRLHWRLAMLPTSAMEYVLVHELAHLLVSRHDRAFWDAVDRVLPDWDARRRWLAAHGARYDL